MTKTDKKLIESKVKKSTVPPLMFLAEPDLLQGVYSNIAVIQHTENEFVIDFLLKFADKGQLVSRVVLSPTHIVALLGALKIDIGKYENSFGKIKKKIEKSEKG